MKILITGGHLTPALAFIDYIKKNHPDDSLVFIGRTHTRKNTNQEAREKHEINKREIEFIPFSSVKLSENNFFEKIKTFPFLILSITKSINLLGKIKPDVFVSFGGYLAVPVAIASWIMRVPIVTHEQTRTAGVANKLISKFANKIAVSYKESIEFFPKNRTTLTGNLIRKSILDNNGIKPKWIDSKDLNEPILYITGGSQGSEIINHTVAQSIKTLIKEWVVIHQCGAQTKTRSYKKELDEVKKKLPKSNRSNYHIREWLNEDELAWIYSNAKAIISRAGANTTEEIANRRIPSILIPLPFSHNDEQLKNAQALSDNKQAILLEQKYLNPKTLIESVDLIKKYNRKFSRNLEMFTKTKDPEKKLYKLVRKIAKN